MSRTWTFLLLLGVGTSLSRPALGQDTSSCHPRDPGAVAHWHSTWDTVTPDRLREIVNGHADRPDAMGPISVPIEFPKVWVPISLESVYGRWRVTARLARLRSSDTGWTGELQLAAAGRRTRREAPNTGWIRRDRVVQGWLVGRDLVREFAESGLDSVPVVGYFSASGSLEIAEGFYVADGGFISADLLGSDRMTGEWSPPGAVLPQFMGWVCAARVPAGPPS